MFLRDIDLFRCRLKYKFSSESSTKGKFSSSSLSMHKKRARFSRRLALFTILLLTDKKFRSNHTART